MQRMQSIGAITPCQVCGRQPKMWYESTKGGQWLLECSPCQNRTPRFGAAQLAVEAWERNEVAAVRVVA